MVSSWQTAWALPKPIYTWTVILLASYEIYSLCDVRTATKRAAKVADNFQGHCPDFSRSHKATIGLMDGLREVAHSMAADNKATGEAIERAMAAGQGAAPPVVAQFSKRLGEAQNVASDCMLSAGLRLLEVVERGLWAAGA